MPKSDGPGKDELEEQCPFAVVDAVFHTMARLAEDIPDADAAWQEFITSREPEQREHWEEVRRSGLPVPIHQQHRLYEYGHRRTGAAGREEFCADCGRQFMRMFSLSNIYSFLRTALSERGSFQQSVVKTVRANLQRYAGSHYVLTDGAEPDAIVLTFENSRPEEDRQYYGQHGLDPDKCFRNAFYFVAGALDKVFSYALSGYDPSSAVLTVSGQKGEMRFPVRSSERLTSEGIIRKVTRYLERLTPGGESAAEDETLDKDLVAGSAAMRETWDRIRRASRSNEIVLLRGESGTGKSFIARKLHELSERRDKPFVEVAMTADVGSDNLIQSDLFGHEKGAFTGADAQKDGLFSLADGGTIFLDEIGDASEELQARLLRVIEAQTFKRLGGVKDITVDVRIIAATNRDLEKMVEEGTFRRDLYYRLSVIPIELPPLRERPEDIPALVDFLLQRIASGGRARRVDLGDGLVDDLRSYPWPGNIRELDHALRHAVTMCEGAQITRDDLPASLCAFLEGRGGKGASVLPRPGAGDNVVNVEALRRAIRSSDPVAAGTSGSPHDIPAHLEHAKRAYLEVLIEEFNGDLGLIARFWDRSSEKTILKLIRDCGLEEKLKEARDEGRKSK